MKKLVKVRGYACRYNTNYGYMISDIRFKKNGWYTKPVTVLMTDEQAACVRRARRTY